MVRSRNIGLQGVFLLLSAFFYPGFPVMAQGGVRVETPVSTTRHDKLPVLDGPFASGREVTRACLSCHTEAADAIQKTIHWTWEFKSPNSGKLFGKAHVFNTFCGSTTSNLRECTSCHIGYGWKDPEIDQVAGEMVDCLVCHEQTGNYKKYNYGRSELVFGGKVIKKPDFVALARSVGRPSRANCGFCHFRGGSGDGAKHGDLDSSLALPDRSLDVHMDAGGLDFKCVTCHTTNGHVITGSRYVVMAQDPLGIDRPGRSDATRTSCASCHGNAPHLTNYKLDDHVDRVACQTCHIPTMARGGVATMVHWDWRTAGKEPGNSEVPDILRQAGHSSEKTTAKHSLTHGTSLWAENLIPRYAWFDGSVDFMLPGESIGDADVVNVNHIHGSARDPDSRIWPFKKMTTTIPYDPVNKVLAINHVIKTDAQDKEAFEVSYDWQRSVAAGMKAAGVPFSGEVGFKESVMYFPLAHMIAPKEKALTCRECHRNGGRMDGVEGIYMPGRKNNLFLHVIGRWFVVMTLLGIMVHAAARILMRNRKV